MKKVSVAVMLADRKPSVDEDHNHDSIFDFPSDDEGYKGDNDHEDVSISEVQWEDDLKRRCDEFIAKQHKQWKEESINDKLDHNDLEEYGGGTGEDLEYSEDNYITAEEEFEVTELS